MRIVSQDKLIDISYEHHDIIAKNRDYVRISAYGDNSETEIILGKYSTEENALKVMEMIRNANMPKIFVNNIGKNEDLCFQYYSFGPYSMYSTDNTMMKQFGEQYFQMPQDSEVEA